MQRRLAAILAADVVGYSAMMRANEAETLDTLRRFKSEHLGPMVSGNNGKILKSMGDGWLVEFASVVDAVSAALRLQDSVSDGTEVRLRIGVHVGDITQDDDDFYGDGVNVAARLEGLADPGEVLISDAAFSGLDGTLAPVFSDHGERQLKNIERPVRIWRRGIGGEHGGGASKHTAKTDLSGYPTLVIIPIATSDPRPEVQELADSITSDVQTFLSQLSWLRVSVAETAPDGAYTLRSTLRTRGDRLRLEARFSEVDRQISNTHKYDGSLKDSFEWQDEVSEDITSQVMGGVFDAETRELATRDPATLTAEQCSLAGAMAWRSFAPDKFNEAIAMQRRALEANPNLVLSNADAIFGMIAGRTVGFHNALREFDDDLPIWIERARQMQGVDALLDLSLAVADYMSDGDAANLSMRLSDCLRRSPFDARVLSYTGWGHIWCGKPDVAFECFEKSMRLGRFSPDFVATLGGAATAQVQLNNPEEALKYAETGLGIATKYATLWSTKAAACAMLDRMEEARAAVEIYNGLTERRTITQWRAYNDYGGSEGRKRYFAALAKAGVTE